MRRSFVAGPKTLRTDVIVALALFVFGLAVSSAAMRSFRASGEQPSFYQANFEPAVMMACGRGFVAPNGPVPFLRDFLLLRRNTFDCADVPAGLAVGPVIWNATWWYLYGTVALIWRIVGVSWTALDGLVAVFGAVTAASLYGLFRLIAAPPVAAAVSVLLTTTPTNLTQLLYLRDYSKAPFMLAATFVLALLIVRPMRPGAVIALSAVAGAIIGLGYGFRSDLAVMLPFGVCSVALFLPGAWRAHAVRNAGAAGALIAAFAVVAWPALKGLSKGGCEFHYSLLGLTTRLTNELGMQPALYNFGDHFLDTFVDLKVGDYADRVLGERAPNLCSPEYKRASGGLFRRLALTFPSDLVAHAYGSVLQILRAGLWLPSMVLPAPPFANNAVVTRGYHALSALTEPVAPLGPILMVAAITCAWAISTRLGIALAIFVLFFGGYPAIEFEARHWFHLRFLPWFAAILVVRAVVIDRARLRSPDRRWIAAAGLTAVILGLVVMLAAFRLVQRRMVASLISQYEAAPIEDLTVGARHGAFLPVAWASTDYGEQPNHRLSDLVVLTLDGNRCAGSGAFGIRTRYEFDAPSHDLSDDIAIARPSPGAAPVRVYVPVFSAGIEDRSYLRFTGIDVVGAPAECITRVARIADRSRLPLWVELQVPERWRDGPLYQTFRLPAALRRFTPAATP